MNAKTVTREIIRGVVISSVLSLGAFGLALSANAATVFYDDFEDGDATGWLQIQVGGHVGSTGVESHNGSLMAFAKDSGASTWGLSHDFSYVSDQNMSFVMQATAIPNGTYQAVGGVKITFLDLFNGTLGSFTIANATDSALTDILVDSAQHSYIASMGTFATQAGLNPAASISKINLTFFAQGQNDIYGFSQSSANVWFDNVTISNGAVPLPATVWLFGSGLLGLIGIARRKKAA
jgi:hypothetical protein